MPKVDRLVLLPMPEANARTAALLSGQVEWIEAPSPDALAQIKQRGFVLYKNEQPHVSRPFATEARHAAERAADCHP